MRNLAILVLAALAGVGSWLFTNHFKIDGLGEIRVSQRQSASAGTEYTAPPVQRTGETIRIASFNIQVFGTRKMRKPAVVEKLARKISSSP